jgi:hypothetical protein
MSAAEPRIYAYGIFRVRDGDDLAGTPAVNGVRGSAVRVLACGGLAALVSDLPAPADAPLDEMWRDPDGIKDMVLDHHRVLQSLAEDRTVLPLRFGAVFCDGVGVATALEQHRQALCETLERIDGAREWGVKIFCDPDALRPLPGWNPDAVRAGEAQVEAASPGRAFFLRRQLEHRAGQDIREAIVRRVADSHRLLSAAARMAATLHVQPPAVHRRTDEMVWHGAYLVARDRERRFFAAIDGLRDLSAQSGFDYDLNGPWPPSSFAHLSLGSA